MDDMQTFERRVTTEVIRGMGPSEPVNDAAIFTAITATPSPKWRFQSMFSATKFVVAGAIVALFGGFLLSGVVTQPSEDGVPPASSPTTSWSPPPGLVIEKVAPGVSRAAFEGIRSVSPIGWPNDFTFDQHGDLWLLSPAGLQRVGDDTTYPGPGATTAFWDLSAASDGALWALADHTIASFRDGVWTKAPPFPGKGPAGALEVLPDGTVWARSATTLARLDGDGWTAYPIENEHGPVSYGYDHPGSLAWTPDGSLWVTACSDYYDDSGLPVRVDEQTSLVRFDGTAFHLAAPPVALDGCRIGPLAVGADGELWAYLQRDPPTLARFDGTRWVVSSDDAGIPPISRWNEYVGTMAVAPDALVWAARGTARSSQNRWWLGAYDGSTWTGTKRVITKEPPAYDLSGEPLRVAPDGSVWVWTDRGDFLIFTPEAVAGTK